MQHNISRLIGPSAAPAASVASIAFNGPARAALNQWIAHAPDITELAGRNEAVRRIVDCIELRAQSLDLDQLSLTELPALLFDMDWLHTLRLAGNRLADAPAQLSQLNHLTLLDLRSNQIADISDNIQRLPARCAVILPGNPLPRETRAHWQSEQMRPDAPNLIFDRAGVGTFVEIANAPPQPRPAHAPALIDNIRRGVIWVQTLRHRGLDADVTTTAQFAMRNLPPPSASTAIAQWALSAGGYGTLLPRLPPEDAWQLDQGPHADSFATWLLRLPETADYHRSAAERTLLNGRVYALLEAIIEHPDLRNLCFAIAHDALESCGDRVALAMNQMEMAWLNHRAEQGELDAPALFCLGRQQYRMEALEKISHGHAQRMRRQHEAIEVFLAFQVGLRERLDLPVGNRAMLYRASSHVEDKDLEQAAVDIESTERQPAAALLDQLAALDTPEHAARLMREPPPSHPLAGFLAQYTPWQQMITRHHPAEQTRHTDTMYDCLEVLTTQLAEGKLNEAQYRDATDQTMLFANAGLAYLKALEAIAADQHPA